MRAVSIKSLIAVVNLQISKLEGERPIQVNRRGRTSGENGTIALKNSCQKNFTKMLPRCINPDSTLVPFSTTTGSSPTLRFQLLDGGCTSTWLLAELDAFALISSVRTIEHSVTLLIRTVNRSIVSAEKQLAVFASFRFLGRRRGSFLGNDIVAILFVFSVAAIIDAVAELVLAD